MIIIHISIYDKTQYKYNYILNRYKYKILSIIIFFRCKITTIFSYMQYISKKKLLFMLIFLDFCNEKGANGCPFTQIFCITENCVSNNRLKLC